jgi:Transposase, Mutator family
VAGVLFLLVFFLPQKRANGAGSASASGRDVGELPSLAAIRLPLLKQFEEPAIAFERIIPFSLFRRRSEKTFPTNAIESLHMQLRKVLKTRGHFPSDEAASKLIYLAVRNVTKKWRKPPVTWKQAPT